MKSIAKSLIAAALITVAGGATAEVLVPGVMTPLPGTTVALEPQLAGLILEDVLQGFSFTANGGTISGTVHSRVVRSDVDGTLDFYWRVMSDRVSSAAMQSFRLVDFYTSSYKVNWRIDGSGNTAPLAALLFAQPGGFVNYEFGSLPGQGLAPGFDSYFMFIDTDATQYAMTGKYDLANMGQSEISGLYATFAPSYVPEPGSVAIFMLGMAGLALTRRRKSTAP